FPSGQTQDEHRSAQLERLAPEEGHGPSFQRAESTCQQTQGKKGVRYEIGSSADQSRQRRIATRHQTGQDNGKNSHARLRHQCPYQTLIGAPTDSCSFLVGQHDGSVVFHTARLWPCGPLANCRLTSHPPSNWLKTKAIALFFKGGSRQTQRVYLFLRTRRKRSQAEIQQPPCGVLPAARWTDDGLEQLAMLEVWLALLDKRLHAFLLIFRGKQRVEVAPLEHQGFVQRAFVSGIHALLRHDDGRQRIGRDG